MHQSDPFIGIILDPCKVRREELATPSPPGRLITSRTIVFRRSKCAIRVPDRASRLGLDACLATKVGSDANGRLILEGLKEEGVDVSRVIVSDATPSAFTYIIVDQDGCTRTCLHTPQTEGACKCRNYTGYISPR